MSKIKIVKADMAMNIPEKLRPELVGLELSVMDMPKLLLVGQTTVGTQDWLNGYRQLHSDCFPVNLLELSHRARRSNRQALYDWLQKLDAEVFVFTSETCERIL